MCPWPASRVRPPARSVVLHWRSLHPLCRALRGQSRSAVRKPATQILVAGVLRGVPDFAVNARAERGQSSLRSSISIIRRTRCIGTSLTVRVERHRDRADAGRVRGRDPGPVPEAREGRALTAVDPPTWTGRLRERLVAALPPEKLLPDRQPSYMASWIYVFGVLSLASLVMIIGSGTVLALKGPGLVARHRHRPLLQQHPSVGGRAVLLLHGDPPVGEVLDGGLAGRPRASVDDRCGHLPGRDPVRADRLRLAAELRRAVDLDPGEGRDELGRASARSSTS